MLTALPTPSQLGGQAHLAQQGRTRAWASLMGLLGHLCDAQALFSKHTRPVSLCTRLMFSCGLHGLTLEDSFHLSDPPELLIRETSPQNEMQGWPRRAPGRAGACHPPNKQPQGRALPA